MDNNFQMVITSSGNLDNPLSSTVGQNNTIGAESNAYGQLLNSGANSFAVDGPMSPTSSEGKRKK